MAGKVLAQIVSRIPGALLRGSTTTVVALGVASACSSEIGVEDTVPAQPGIVMPEGGGSAIDESAACERLLSALSDARSKLKCPAETAECPGYIRPAGSQACLQYDEATVAGCERVIGAYTRCSDFDSRRCIVSALPGTRSEGCQLPPTDDGGDAEPDAEPDAGEDSSMDASDAGDDGSTDASDAGTSDTGTRDTGTRDAADSGGG
jgi:hypothetical protein